MTDSMNYGMNISSFFHAYWQIDNNDFLTGQSRCLLKFWHTDVGPEQEFWCCFTDGLLWQKTKTRVKFACGAGYYTGPQTMARQVPVMHVVRSNMILPGHHQFLAGQMQQS